ncbi:FG-GAP-like repeat-containing protein [Chitinophaga sp. YIM B06452]|uniref:FG-GAP-like repeat-containing protein n=1 Tax=Chitinophaga sp. YIM B06452 TaxID=3082158 RepID=UPI0031FEDC1F
MFSFRIKILFCALVLLLATLHSHSQTAPFVDATPAGFGNLNTVGGFTAWADYDNDGDLDVCMAGLESMAARSHVRIFRNDGGGSFTDIGVDFGAAANISTMTIIWLDYDNDGWQDLLLIPGGKVLLYHNNNGVFTEAANTGLPAVLVNSAGAAGDYDNDGYPDLALSGFDNTARVSVIYHNNRQGGFEATGIPLLGVAGGDLAWADYDKDGLLDLMLIGFTETESANRLYRNLGNGNFSAGTMLGSFGYHNGTIAWGDYDNDGYPDLLLAGFSSQNPDYYLTSIFHNNGGAGFTADHTTLPGVSGTAAWGDYNNDGLLDVVLAGQTVWEPEQSTTQVYRNNGGNNFSLAATLPSRTFSAASWADYNKDGRLDLLWIGSELGNSFACKLYRNTIAAANTRPAAPSGLTHAISADEKSVTFTWQPAQDGQTAAAGLYYNIYLYEDPGSNVKINPYAGPGGYRRLVGMGNTTQNTSYTFHGLSYDKVYRWSVQAVDAAWAGSAFAAERSFPTRKTQTIQLNDLIHQYGDPDFVPATLNSGLPLMIQLGNPSAAELLPDGKIRIKAVDTCSLIAWHPGNAEWLPFTLIQETMQFLPGTLTVAADNKNITYGDALPALTYSITGFAGSETESVLTQPVQISTTATGSSGVGTYPITTGGAAAANYTFVYPPGTLTISPKKLEIVLPPIADKVYGAADFVLSVQADPALPLTFSSSQPGVATIDVNGNIHLTGTGTTQIAAMQQTGGNYLGDTALVTLRVTQASQTLTFPAIAPKTFGDADFDPQVQSSAGLPIQLSSSDPNVATIVDGKIHITGAGTATITATQSGNTNYSSATATAALTVNKAAQTITFQPLPAKTFGDADFSPQAQSSVGLPITFTSSDANVATVTAGGDIHITGTGSVTITATQSGNANYNSATATAVLTVGKATQTITFQPIPAKTFGDADFTPQAQSSAGLPITTFNSSDADVATITADGNIHITGAGTAIILATQIGDANYNSATASAVLTVNKATQTITFDPLPAKIFGDMDFAPQAQSSAGLPLQFSSSDANVATITADGKIHITGTGTVTITATQSGNTNYNGATATAVLTVGKAAQTITFQPLPAKTFGDADFAPQAQSSTGLPVTFTSSDANVAAITSSGDIHITGTGSATITATQGGNPNYSSATATAVLTVGKATQTITFQPLPAKTFGDADFAPQAQSSVGLPIIFTSSNTNVATITAGGDIHITGVGTATITASQSGNANYNSATATAVLTVGKATQTLTFQPLPVKTFGDADFAPQAQSSAGLPVTIFTSSDANVATITADGNIHITGAGTATITASQPGNSNYNNAAATAVLTVNKATQTVTIDPLPVKTFGDADFAFNARASTGLPLTFSSANANVATIAADGTIHITGAGTVSITATQSGTGNYEAASATATLTVGKAAQQVTLANLPVKTFGDADFAAGAIASSGLPVVYTSSDAGVATVNASGQIHITGAGTVTITATQPGNGNYAAAVPVAKQLVVKKAAQTITFGPLTARNVNEPPFNPGATASSGLPITYEIENTTVATAANALVTPLRAGITRITARQPGNRNVEAATPVTQELEITSSGKEIKVNDAVTPNGDGINDHLQIEGLRNFPDNEIHIANAAGRIVFEAKPYKGDFKGYASHGSQLLPKGVYYYVFFYTSGGARKKVTGYFVLEY